MPSVVVAAFSSAVVLLISGWGAQKRGVTVDMDMHVRDIKRCIRFLSVQETMFIQAGKLVDIIYTLASYGETPVSNDIDEITPPYASITNKRDRSEEADGEPEPQTWHPHPTVFPPTSDIDPHSAQPTNGITANVPVSNQYQYQDLPLNTAALSQPTTWMNYEYQSSTNTHGGPPTPPSSIPFNAVPGDPFPNVNDGSTRLLGPDPLQWGSNAALLPEGQVQDDGFYAGDTLWSSMPTTGFEWDEWGHLIDELNMYNTTSSVPT